MDHKDHILSGIGGDPKEINLGQLTDAELIHLLDSNEIYGDRAAPYIAEVLRRKLSWEISEDHE